ncbi:MAG: hypothetical protein D6693_07695 [Planctomycetota bacterium]|nr:MAG: hypothetical protein D6693_07695 [Planctomycetota bacterium]
MLFLNPHEVTLDGAPLGGVRAITLSRRATRLAVEHDDAGPHPVFADAPEQRATLTVHRDLTSDDPGLDSSLAPGRQAALAFTTSPNASDASPRAFAATAVITAVETDLRRDADAARQTLTLLLVSATGGADPFDPVFEAGPQGGGPPPII